MKILRASVFFLGLALLAASCKNESADAPDAGPIVARVGDREVTLDYFENRLEKMERRYLPDTLDLEGKREFLNFIINKELMALKAEDLGYSEDDAVRDDLALMEETIIAQEVIAQVTAGMDSVAEDEIKNFYDRQKVQRLVKHILFATRRAADEAFKDLQAGANFDSLADAGSIVPRIDQNGEQLPLSQRVTFGWVEYGQATPTIEAAIFDGPLNVPSDPVQSPYGWHIFLAINSKDQKQAPYDEVKELLRRQIVGRRKTRAREAYFESILTQNDFQLDDDALNLVYSKLPADGGEAPDVNFEVKPVIPFTHEERNMTLFTVNGDKFTIGDFSDRFDATPWIPRPKRLNGTMGIRYFIRDEILKGLRRKRADEDGVSSLPDVANEMKNRREEMMVGALHANLIGFQLPEPTEEELVQFFEAHPTHYVDREKRTCNIIFHPRERVVRRAHQEIVDGADFIETAIRYNDSALEADDVRTVAFTRDDEKHVDIAEIAFGLDLQEYTEPFRVSSEENNGWIMLQVQQIIAEKPFEFEDVEEFVRRDWRNDWSEKRLNELLEEWKADYTVEVFEDVLDRAEVRRDDITVPGATSSADAGVGDTN